VQHRGGLYRRQQGEADVLSGDENLVDVNLVVQYRAGDPHAALFHVGERLADGSNKWDTLVRAVAETVLRAEMARRPSDDVLASRRAELEQSLAAGISAALQRYGTGFCVEHVCLADVHPPLEVVDAFRDVAGAHEEKEAAINNAQGDRSQTKALAQGKAAETVLAAEASAYDRTQRAGGSAARFAAVAAAYRKAPVVTRVRMYLQTVEQLLAGRRKVILDHAAGGGRRRIFLGREGLWSLPPGAQVESPPEQNTSEGNP